MKKKRVIIGGGRVCAIIGLFLLISNVGTVPSVNASNNNCVDIDCLMKKLKSICETEPNPEYLDCENILRCIDGGEQEVMECAKGYSLLENETMICNSPDLLYRSWCNYDRGSIPK